MPTQTAQHSGDGPRTCVADRYMANMNTKPHALYETKARPGARPQTSYHTATVPIMHTAITAILGKSYGALNHMPGHTNTHTHEWTQTHNRHGGWGNRNDTT